MDVERASRFPRFIADSLHIGKPIEKISENDPRFHPRERGTQARVNTMAESDVRIGIARDVELFGVVEVFCVAIGRADHGKNELAGRKSLAA